MRKDEIKKPITIVEYNLMEERKGGDMPFEQSRKKPAFIKFYVSEKKYKEIMEGQSLDDYLPNIEVAMSKIAKAFVRKRLGEDTEVTIISYDDTPNFAFEVDQDNGHFIEVSLKIDGGWT